MVAAAGPQLRVVHGRVDLDHLLNETQGSRANAHHHVRLSIQGDRLTDDVRIAAKDAPPEAMTQNDHILLSGLGLVRTKWPSQVHGEREHVEETRRDHGAPERHGLTPAGEVEFASKASGPHGGKGLGAGTPVKVVKS